MTTKKVLSSAETAKMLNVSLRTVQLWVEKGVLAAWKTPGGHRRISLESIQKLKHQQDVQVGFVKPSVKLLIVEDQAHQRKFYRKCFERWNLPVEVYMAKDGYHGLIKLGEMKPDLLITDLMMPSMDGSEMIKAIRSKGDLDENRIIVVTAMDSDSAEVKRLRDSNITVLQKPVSFDDLKQLLENRVSMLATAAKLW
ncbi:response regulator [Motiliproteus sp. MSK22-1]|uniref:response regulator n=1 Tax=Motiliproteus sp. MSK22-1 TaxID=1897630 RepID=UPI000978CE56|nr:response regulator [Motiliproteus sp. MSK22-1]OMH38318.1 hypothetical protein BGP75_08730 [Motiliproteus sp. MSK22-1]